MEIIMLPEHVRAFNDLFEEQDHKQKLILDDQELIEIDAKLRQDKKDNLTKDILDVSVIGKETGS